MTSYSLKELEALEVFSEYITVDQPYNDMDKVSYYALHSHFKNLPSCVFSNRKLKNLYHFGLAQKRDNIHTDSGIVSCTTKAGISHIKFDWEFREGDCLYKLRTPPEKTVSATKLYNTLNRVGVECGSSWLKSRICNEREYIVLLEDVVAQKVEEWDGEEYKWTLS